LFAARRTWRARRTGARKLHELRRSPMAKKKKAKKKGKKKGSKKRSRR
jgi:hypothetical protein